MKQQIIVRSPNPKFKRQVEQLARRNGVSVNELVIAALTRTLRNDAKRSRKAA